MKFYRSNLGAFLLVGISCVYAQQADDNPMRAMKDELSRSISQLQLQQMDKPYFLAYRMEDISEKEISATLGSLTTSSGLPIRRRMLGVELRVGDYSLDNTNFLSMQRLQSGPAGMFGGIEQGTLDDSYDQIRREFWLATDRQYKRALEDLAAKKAALKMRNTSETIPDFSKEQVANVRAAQTVIAFNSSQFEPLVRELSAVFRSDPEIDVSSVTIAFRDTYTRYVNSEGTSFTRSQPLLKLEVIAKGHTSDGLPISDSFAIYGHAAGDLPAKTDLRSRVEQLAARVVKLRSAATLENYNGPVLFEESAAGEVILQEFASRLAAARTPMSDNPQFELVFNQMLNRLGGASFHDRIGARVLPDFISVRDDPSQSSFAGTNLMGNFAIDDDGVPSRNTALIEHGILKSLLSSRAPVRGILQSTGSRHGWGVAPSNLFLRSDKALSSAELKAELLRRAKERGLDYGIVIRRVGGGSAASFIQMARQMAQQGGSESLPEAYKLFSDGHEVPLRGVHISELSAESFKEIVATSDVPIVYSDEMVPRMTSIFSMGLSAGAGELPVVSCITPSLLFEELSLVKSEGPYPAPPLSPSPLAEK